MKTLQLTLSGEINTWGILIRDLPTPQGPACTRLLFLSAICKASLEEGLILGDPPLLGTTSNPCCFPAVSGPLRGSAGRAFLHTYLRKEVNGFPKPSGNATVGQLLLRTPGWFPPVCSAHWSATSTHEAYKFILHRQVQENC